MFYCTNRIAARQIPDSIPSTAGAIECTFEIATARTGGPTPFAQGRRVTAPFYADAHSLIVVCPTRRDISSTNSLNRPWYFAGRTAVLLIPGLRCRISLEQKTGTVLSDHRR